MNSPDLLELNNKLSKYALKVVEKPWDSSILNKKVFSIEILPGAPNVSSSECQRDLTDVIMGINQQLSAYGPIMLMIRIPALNTGIIRAIEDSKFHLIECYVEFKHDLIDIPSEKGGSNIRNLVKEDIQQLEEIARSSFLYSRFHSDPEIDIEAANKSRAEWVKNSCLGRAEAVLVAESGGRLKGFAICQIKGQEEERYGNLDLIAVQKDFRGQKTGHDLTLGFLQFCKKNNLIYGSVGTQAHNIPSVRMYEKAGFLIHRSFYTYHKHING